MAGSERSDATVTTVSIASLEDRQEGRRSRGWRADGGPGVLRILAVRVRGDMFRPGSVGSVRPDEGARCWAVRPGAVTLRAWSPLLSP